MNNIVDIYIYIIYILYIMSLMCVYVCLYAQSCLILCDPMDCSSPGFSVLHCLLEFAQIHVH